MKSANRTARFAATLLLVLTVAAPAQWNKKPYTEWSEKEAQKVLEDSPWAQTQTFSDTSLAFTRSRVADVSHINFRIRFLSATPVRQAFSRLIGLKQKDAMNEQLAEKLRGFAQPGAFPDYVVISVDVEAKEQRGQLQEATLLVRNRTTAELKHNTYLMGNGGQRVFLKEFRPPTRDGLGANFVFPRLVDGKPYITEESDEVRFYCEFSKDYTLNMRFKVKDMMLDGKLEY